MQAAGNQAHTCTDIFIFCQIVQLFFYIRGRFATYNVIHSALDTQTSVQCLLDDVTYVLYLGLAHACPILMLLWLSLTTSIMTTS